MYVLSVELTVLVHLKNNQPILEFLRPVAELLVECYTVETEQTEWHSDTQRRYFILQSLIAFNFLLNIKFHMI